MSDIKVQPITATVFLSRRNLLTLLSKLDRKAKGEQTHCTLIKYDTSNPKYPQNVLGVVVTAVEDADYYDDRDPGDIVDEDAVRIAQQG